MRSSLSNYQTTPRQHRLHTFFSFTFPQPTFFMTQNLSFVSYIIPAVSTGTCGYTFPSPPFQNTNLPFISQTSPTRFTSTPATLQRQQKKKKKKIQQRTLPTSSSMSSTSSSTPFPKPTPHDLLVVGPGVLGSYIIEKYLAHTLDVGANVYAMSRTTNSHEKLRKMSSSSGQVVPVLREDLAPQRKFRKVVFCAPPSGNLDYLAQIQQALDRWDGGQHPDSVFVFTSSSGVYDRAKIKELWIEKHGTAAADDDDLTHRVITDELSARVDPNLNPRAGALVCAEDEVHHRGGTVLRLTGLYTVDRGAHNYWLHQSEPIPSYHGTLICLISYEDAADLAVKILNSPSEMVANTVFLGCDNVPLTRLQICQAATAHPKYKDMKLPDFVGTKENEALSFKIDASWTWKTLDWKPKYESFTEFMKK